MPSHDFLQNLGVPTGFKRIQWIDVEEGQEVYLWGSCRSENGYSPKAYGPHKVHKKKGRRLINGKGVVFMQYSEELLVKE